MSKGWNDSKAGMAQAISAFVPTIGTEGDHNAFIASLAPSSAHVRTAPTVADRFAAVLGRVKR